jgi:hypothetical protein
VYVPPEPQSLFDRLVNGKKNGHWTTETEVVPLSQSEIANQALGSIRLEYEAEQLRRANELAAYRHHGDLAEQGVRILGYEKQAHELRLDLLDLNCRYEATARQWPDREATETARILEERYKAEERMLAARNARDLRALRNEVEFQKTKKALGLIPDNDNVIIDVTDEVKPRVAPLAHDQLRAFAARITEAAVAGTITPNITRQTRWHARAGCTYLERVMRTDGDFQTAREDTYQAVLGWLDDENRGRYSPTIDDARWDYESYLELRRQAEANGLFNKVMKEWRKTGQRGGDDVFASDDAPAYASNVTRIFPDTN